MRIYSVNINTHRRGGESWVRTWTAVAAAAAVATAATTAPSAPLLTKTTKLCYQQLHNNHFKFSSRIVQKKFLLLL